MIEAMKFWFAKQVVEIGLFLVVVLAIVAVAGLWVLKGWAQDKIAARRKTS